MTEVDVDLKNIIENIVGNNGTEGDGDKEHASVEDGPTDPPPPSVTPGIKILSEALLSQAKRSECGTV